MSIAITLNFNKTVTPKGTVKLDITTAGTDIDDKVFAIEVLPTSADATAAVYRFSHVCSPSELVEFPPDVPLDNCYFRTNNITMIFDTVCNADLVLSHIKTDIKKLTTEYKQLENIAATTAVDVL